MAKQMPKISSCDQTNCSYNKHNACHTLGITVGGPAEDCPTCDTFFQASEKGGMEDVTGGVGACKVDECQYNQSLECSAQSISVGTHEAHPDCMTFKSR